MFKEVAIKSIKPIGIRTVYDITVKDNHSYVANGFVNHNSSQNPNLQNIPRDTTSSDIKKMFIPPPGRVLLQLDYSQAELRVMATMAKETTMLRWFKEGKDIHLTTALQMEHQEDRYEEIKELLDRDDPKEKDLNFWKEKRKGAKCYTGDTEILTEKGWQRLDSYDGKTKVAQYDFETEVISFTEHEGYGTVNSQVNYTYKDRNIELDVTEEHKTLFITRAGKKVKDDFKNLVGKNGYMPSAGYIENTNIEGEDFTRFLAMFIADGNIKNKRNIIRFGFSKDRKIDRCITILKTLGITFNKRLDKNGNTKICLPKKTNREIYKKISLYSSGKVLNWGCLLSLDGAIYLDEAKYWDSYLETKYQNDRASFSTVIEQNADIMQAWGSINGIRVIKTNLRNGRTFRLSYRPGGKTLSRVNLAHAKRYEVENGQTMWSVTVPKRNLVTRKNGKVVLSGNTINFGIIYGQGIPKLAAGLGVSNQEAKQYLNQYFKRFPKVQKFVKKQHRFAMENAYVKNLFGRKRRLWDVDSSEKWLVAQALRQCTDELTEALSKEGWKKYNKLREGEEILTKNPLTGVLEWQPIQKLNIYPDFKGDLYHFKNKSFDALVTGEHRWLANVTTKRNTNNFYKTQELYEGKLRLIHRQGYYVGPKESPYSDDLINLVGWVLTDGSLRYYDLPGKPRHGKPWKVTLTQSYTANPHKVKLIDELLGKLGYNYHKKDKGSSYNWVFNKGLADELHKIIPNKRLTMPFLLSLPKHQLEILYNSMSLGDGHRGGNAIITGKEDQADMIQVLNILLGRTSNINIRDRVGRKCYSDKISNKKGYIEIKNKSYSVSSGRRKYFHTKSTRGENHITKLENQEQLVWCPTVENQSWVARRNGKQYITGNSVNSPIQGAASDLTLFSSILIWEQCRNGQIEMDLPQAYTVHDSLGYFPKPEDLHTIVPKLQAICENPETMEWFGFQIDDVKMAVDFEVSHKNWGELRAYDPKFDYTTLF